MIPAALKPWVAFGSGAGIEIEGPRGSESMRIAAVRVRPNGARLLDSYTVEDFAHQPAGVWGTEYAAFVKKHGMQHAVAAVLLPRRDVIVRLLALPGVSDKDLAGAIQFQLEGLHPYGDDDVVTSWARLGASASVLVVIARRDVIERYTTLFAEAGVKVGCFTASAAAIYSALRLFGRTPADAILAFETSSRGEVEVYAESAIKPVLSASFPGQPDRAQSLVAAELRFEKAPETLSFEQLLGAAPALPYAAALLAACPRLSLPLNLLPEDLRQSSSPMAWIPAAALGGVVLLLAGGLAAFPYVEEGRYRKSLDAEVAKLQPAVTRANSVDRQIVDTLKRTALLDDFRRRPRADMDVLAELTRLLPPPAWLNLLELNAKQVTVAGETDQAAPLLRTLDASPLFISSEFNLPPMRIQSPDGLRNGEAFRVRTNREALQPVAPPPVAVQPVGQPAPQPGPSPSAPPGPPPSAPAGQPSTTQAPSGVRR